VRKLQHFIDQRKPNCPKTTNQRGNACPLSRSQQQKTTRQGYDGYSWIHFRIIKIISLENLRHMWRKKKVHTKS